jgi:hypothetical protein
MKNLFFTYQNVTEPAHCFWGPLSRVVISGCIQDSSPQFRESLKVAFFKYSEMFNEFLGENGTVQLPQRHCSAGQELQAHDR